MLLKSESNLVFLERICKELGHHIQDNFTEEQVGEAYFYCFHIIDDFKKIADEILLTFLEGEPRKRYIILKGDFRSGKTSLASAFCKLLQGVTINLNVDSNRLNFHLGNALEKRYVLFDDVKGRAVLSENLLPGPGFANLDNLRDHLDGHVPVQLEKKNQQPVEQIFPPGIITCNNYQIPQSILARIKKLFYLKHNGLFQIHGPKIVTKEIIFIGLVLCNLLPVQPYVFEHIYRLKTRWETQHNMTSCPCRRRVSYLALFFVWSQWE